MRLTGYNTKRARFDVQMTPMIDVVFQLLIFFVCTVSFQKQEQALQVTPKLAATSGSGTAQQPIPRELEDLRQVELQLRRNAGRTEWLVNQDLCPTAEAVRARLTALARIAEYKRIVPVVLDAADDVPMGDAVDIYDLCLTLGFEKVQFVAPE